MKNVVVIPCRGGSKGIARKNLQAVHGIPLVVRTIFTCLEAGINDIFVSTDNDEIGAYARAAGARVIDRPHELAQDESSTDSVLSHAIQALLELGFVAEDNLFLLQATSPFTKSKTIQRAYTHLQNNPDSGVFTATEWHGFVWDLKEAVASPFFHDFKHRKRRQDLTPQILETGGLYGGSIARFKDSEVRFVQPLVPILVDRVEAIEIDSLGDLNFCNSISMRKKFESKSDIKVIFTDFDGVWTDNRVLQFETSEMGCIINRSDGVAISQLKSQGFPVVIITGEDRGAAFGRAEKLGILCIYSQDKLRSIVQYCIDHSVKLSEIAYVGNDLNDLEPLATCGWTFTPEDAHPTVSKFASQVLHTKGGQGVIRELADNLLRKSPN